MRPIFNILLLVLAVGFITGCASNKQFTIVLLPDTQNYTDSSWDGKPQYFYDQTQWIKENHKERNIVMVAHLGDIVQHAMVTEQWDIASKAFATIDNETPYILSLGNHDLRGPRNKEGDERDTIINDYFPPKRFTENSRYQNNFGRDNSAHFMQPGRSDNYYLYFKGGKQNYLVIALEFQPRDATLQWANNVVEAHPDYQCIVVTHKYLNHDNQINTAPQYKIIGNNPQQMWDKFISQHANIFMLFCGHHMGETVRTTKGIHGNTVHQILVDYQNGYIGKGGNGYLRIMTFSPADGTIKNTSYSPTLDQYLTREKSEFTLMYK